MTTARRTWWLIAALMTLAVVSTAASGCAEKTASIPDPNGTYHFMAPASWTNKTNGGVVTVFASDKKPSRPTSDTLSFASSIIALTMQDTSKRPLPDQLKAFITYRSQIRSWKSKTVGPVNQAMIGGRKGYSADVSGRDSSGREFKARFYMIRTSGRQVLIIVESKPAAWDTFSKQVDTIMKNWYWQLPANAK